MYTKNQSMKVNKKKRRKQKFISSITKLNPKLKRISLNQIQPKYIVQYKSFFCEYAKYLTYKFPSIYTKIKIKNVCNMDIEIDTINQISLKGSFTDKDVIYSSIINLFTKTISNVFPPYISTTLTDDEIEFFVNHYKRFFAL